MTTTNVSPMCPRCRVPVVRFHHAKPTEAQTGRNYFECPSCFVISSTPISYVIERTPEFP
jgi:hypothetical protein